MSLPLCILSVFLTAFRDPVVPSPATMDSSSMAMIASLATVSVLPVPVPSPASPLICLLVLFILFGSSQLLCSTQYVSSECRGTHFS